LAAAIVAAVAIVIDSIFEELHWRDSGEPDSAAIICGLMTVPDIADNLEVEGCIINVLPGNLFRVELDNRHLVLATVSSKMWKRWVRLAVGDRVKMDMAPHELNKARITCRLKLI
jgi:translation initiation factor IF-1